MLARVQAAQADFAALEAGGSGPLTVGVYQSVGARLLPDLMREFGRRHPDVEIRLREAVSDREAWQLLGLISFFTAGEGKEGRAWAIPRGTSARRAAGQIHTDIEKGFVAAEVVGWEDLVAAGGYAEARERAKLRVEGREYEVRDGDVITVRFTP